MAKNDNVIDPHADPAKLREEAKAWDEQAARLDQMRSRLFAAHHGMRWTGAASSSADKAINAVAFRITSVADSARSWAQQLRYMATETEKQIAKEKKEALFHLLVGLFSVLLLPLDFTLLPALVLNVVKTIVSVAVRLGVVATRAAQLALDFTVGAVVYGVEAFAIDMAAQGIATGVSKSPFELNKSAEGLNVGLGALLGGLFSMRPNLFKKAPDANPAIHNVPAPKAPTPTGAANGTHPATLPGTSAGRPTGRDLSVGRPEVRNSVAGSLNAAAPIRDVPVPLTNTGARTGAEVPAASTRTPPISRQNVGEGVDPRVGSGGQGTLHSPAATGGVPLARLDNPGPPAAVTDVGPAALSGRPAVRSPNDPLPSSEHAVGTGARSTPVTPAPHIGSEPPIAARGSEAHTTPPVSGGAPRPEPNLDAGRLNTGGPARPLSPAPHPGPGSQPDLPSFMKSGGTLPEARIVRTPEALGTVPAGVSHHPPTPPMPRMPTAPDAPHSSVLPSHGTGSPLRDSPTPLTSHPDSAIAGGARPPSVADLRPPPEHPATRAADRVVTGPDAHTVAPPPREVAPGSATGARTLHSDPFNPSARGDVGESVHAAAGTTALGGSPRLPEVSAPPPRSPAPTPHVTEPAPHGTAPDGAAPHPATPRGGEGRTHLDDVAAGHQQRHEDLAAQAGHPYAPTRKEAAAGATDLAHQLQRAAMKEGWPGGGPVAKVAESSGTQLLRRFGDFFAAEAGVVDRPLAGSAADAAGHNIDKLRTDIRAEYAAVKGDDIPAALSDIAGRIAREAGIPESRIGNIVHGLNTVDHAAQRQAIRDFRAEIQAFRGEAAGVPTAHPAGGASAAASGHEVKAPHDGRKLQKVNPTDLARSLESGRQLFKTSETAEQAARAHAGVAGDNAGKLHKMTRAEKADAAQAKEAAGQAREAEVRARDWAASREKEFVKLQTGLSDFQAAANRRGIWETVSSAVGGNPHEKPVDPISSRPGVDSGDAANPGARASSGSAAPVARPDSPAVPVHASGADLDARFGAKLQPLEAKYRTGIRLAGDVERLRPNIQADFLTEVRNGTNLAMNSELVTERVGVGLRGMTKAETATLLADFHTVTERAFKEFWEPKITAGRGLVPDEFKRLKTQWNARYDELRAQVRANNVAHYEMQLLEPHISRAADAAAMRGVSAADIAVARRNIEHELQVTVADLVRANLARLASTSAWDRIRIRMRNTMQLNMDDFFVDIASRARPGASGVPSPKPKDPVAPYALDGPPGGTDHLQRLTAEGAAATRAFRELDPEALARVSDDLAGHLATSYTRDRLRAFDEVYAAGNGAPGRRTPDSVISRIAGEARVLDLPLVPRPELHEHIRDRAGAMGLATTKLAGGTFVHADVKQIPLDSALVAAAAGKMHAMPGHGSVFVGPGVDADALIRGLDSVAKRNAVFHTPLLGAAERLALADRTGATVALGKRPDALDAQGHVVPVNASGVRDFQFRAVEWHYGPGGGTRTPAPAGVEEIGRSTVYRLPESWVLEDLGWGRWARPSVVPSDFAMRVRAGGLRDEQSTLVVGGPDGEVPAAVLAELKRVDLETGPTRVTWLGARAEGWDTLAPAARPAGDTALSPAAAWDRAKATNAARFHSAADFDRTAVSLREAARADFDRVSGLGSPNERTGLDATRARYLADVDRLIERHLGGGEGAGWHDYADVGAFGSAYGGMKDLLQQRLKAHSLWGDARPTVEDLITRGPAGERRDLFGEHARPIATDFVERFESMVVKSVDELVAGGRIADLEATVRGHLDDVLGHDRLTTLADHHAWADDLLAQASSSVRGIGRGESSELDEASRDAVRNILTARLRKEHQSLFGPDGAHGIEKSLPLSRETPSAADVRRSRAEATDTFAQRIDATLTAANVDSVYRTVDTAYQALRRADPELRPTGLADRLELASLVVEKFDRVLAERTQKRLAEGLTDNVTPAERAAMLDDLVAEVDATAHRATPDDLAGDGLDLGVHATSTPPHLMTPEELRARLDTIMNDDLGRRLDRSGRAAQIDDEIDDAFLRLELHDELNGSMLRESDLERLRDQLGLDLRRAHDRIHHSADGPTGTPAARDAAWAETIDRFRTDLPARFDQELDDIIELRKAATDFHALEAADGRVAGPVRPDHFDQLAATYRADRMADHDRIWHHRMGERSSWLAHEKANGDTFGTDLAAKRGRELWTTLDARFGADTAAALRRMGIGPEQRELAGPAVTQVKQLMMQEFRQAEAAGERLGYAQAQQYAQRYRDLADSLESRLTIAMLADRAGPAVDRAVATHLGETSGSAGARKLKNAVTEEFDAGFRRQLSADRPRPLPRSLGLVEQEHVLNDVSNAAMRVVAQRTGIRLDASLDKARAGLVEDLLKRDPVPVRADAGFLGEKIAMEQRVSEELAEALARRGPVDQMAQMAANMIQRDLVTDLSRRNAGDWDFDRRTWETHLSQTLAAADVRIDGLVRRWSEEARLEHELGDLVQTMADRWPADARSQRAAGAAGEALTAAVSATFARLHPNNAGLDVQAVTTWRERYDRMVESPNDWYAAHALGERLQTAGDALPPSIRDEFREAARQVLSPHLTFQEGVKPSPSAGGAQLDALLDSIGNRLGGGRPDVRDVVEPVLAGVRTSLDDDPIPGIARSGLSGDGQPLASPVRPRLDDLRAQEQQRAQTVIDEAAARLGLDPAALGEAGAAFRSTVDDWIGRHEQRGAPRAYLEWHLDVLYGNVDSWLAVQRLKTRMYEELDVTLTNAAGLPPTGQTLFDVIEKEFRPYQIGMVNHEHRLAVPRIENGSVTYHSAVGPAELNDLAEKVGHSLARAAADLPVAADVASIGPKVVASLDEHPIETDGTGGLATRLEVFKSQLSTEVDAAIERVRGLRVAPGDPVRTSEQYQSLLAPAGAKVLDRLIREVDLRYAQRWSADGGDWSQFTNGLDQIDALVAEEQWRSYHDTFGRRLAAADRLEMLATEAVDQAQNRFGTRSAAMTQAGQAYVATVMAEFDRRYPVDEPFSRPDEQPLTELIGSVDAWMTVHMAKSRMADWTTQFTDSTRTQRPALADRLAATLDDELDGYLTYRDGPRLPAAVDAVELQRLVAQAADRLDHEVRKAIAAGTVDLAHSTRIRTTGELFAAHPVPGVSGLGRALPDAGETAGTTTGQFAWLGNNVAGYTEQYQRDRWATRVGELRRDYAARLATAKDSGRAPAPEVELGPPQEAPESALPGFGAILHQTHDAVRAALARSDRAIPDDLARQITEDVDAVLTAAARTAEAHADAGRRTPTAIDEAVAELRTVAEKLPSTVSARLLHEARLAAEVAKAGTAFGAILREDPTGGRVDLPAPATRQLAVSFAFDWLMSYDRAFGGTDTWAAGAHRPPRLHSLAEKVQVAPEVERWSTGDLRRALLDKATPATRAIEVDGAVLLGGQQYDDGPDPEGLRQPMPGRVRVVLGRDVDLAGYLRNLTRSQRVATIVSIPDARPGVLRAVAKQHGVTVALNEPPIDLRGWQEATPVNAAGSVVPSHLATEWHIIPPGLAPLPFFPLKQLRPHVYALSDGWILMDEWTGIRVFPPGAARPSARRTPDSAAPRLLIGRPGIVLPKPVARDLSSVVEKLRKTDERPVDVEWLSEPHPMVAAEPEPAAVPLATADAARVLEAHGHVDVGHAFSAEADPRRRDDMLIRLIPSADDAVLRLLPQLAADGLVRKALLVLGQAILDEPIAARTASDSFSPLPVESKLLLVDQVIERAHDAAGGPDVMLGLAHLILDC
ncbi:hypothetical protein [Actinoplanes sp. NPDC049265]|uniref:hypothetical protein n=1 Tax=Actinoplanes sp. NPDC049265 TaxID=3363902 RepID=UPI003715E33B